MMETVGSSEKLLTTYQTTRCYNPEDNNMNQWKPQISIHKFMSLVDLLNNVRNNILNCILFWILLAVFARTWTQQWTVVCVTKHNVNTLTSPLFTDFCVGGHTSTSKLGTVYAQRNYSDTFTLSCLIFPENLKIYVKKYGHKLCITFFFTTSARNIFRSDEHSASYTRDARAGLHVKCPALLSDFKLNWEASTNFSNNYPT
jgi:hypothetical protein